MCGGGVGCRGEGWGGKEDFEFGAVRTPSGGERQEAGEGSSSTPTSTPRPCAGGPRARSFSSLSPLMSPKGKGRRVSLHPYPSQTPAAQSLPVLTLRAPSPAAGGARSAALRDPGLPPLPLSPLPGDPSCRGHRRAAPRGASRYVRLGGGSPRGWEGGGSRGGRKGGGRARALPGCAAAETPAGGRRLQGGGRVPSLSPAGRPAPRLPRGEARHRYARGAGTAGTAGG